MRIYWPMIHSIRAYYPNYIKNSCNLTPKRQTTLLKWSGELDGHFLKEDIQMANRHMKRCSMSLIIREVEIKTTEFHLTLVRKAMINKSTNMLAGMW